MEWIAGWGVSAIVAGVLAGVLASRKNRNYSSWMDWCFLLLPLVLVLAFLPRVEGEPPRRPTIDEERDSYKHE